MAEDIVLDTRIHEPPAPGSQVGGSLDLRRVLVDLHDECARHAGHADLLRGAVGGLVGEDPPKS
jgi:hypothetical protein